MGALMRNVTCLSACTQGEITAGGGAGGCANPNELEATNSNAKRVDFFNAFTPSWFVFDLDGGLLQSAYRYEDEQKTPSHSYAGPNQARVRPQASGLRNRYSALT